MSLIRPIAICVFQHQGHIPVSEEYDSVKDQRFYRPLGGGIAFGENSEQALRREIREELGAEIEQPRLLGVLENLFTYERRQGHEIVFVYDARFADPSLYRQPGLEGYEEGIDESFKAIWLSLEALVRNDPPVYPEGLRELLRATV